MILLSFIAFMSVFAVVGLLAKMQSRKSSYDYLLSGGNVSPFFTALSAMASKASGYMFIGFIGYVYTNGAAGAWLMAGQITGDIILFHFLGEKIKKAHSHNRTLSYEDLACQREGGIYKRLRLLLGVLIVFLLVIYAAAQLKAGGKALHVILELPQYFGILLCAFFVLFYCWSGGIRASIWTDVIQSIIMLAAGVALTFYSIYFVGGWETFSSELRSISTNYFIPFPSNLVIGGAAGLALFFVGWVFNGFCVLGQPHVMVRLMVLDDIKNLNKMRFYYYSANILLGGFLFLVGVSARLILGEKLDMLVVDPELAMPLLSLEVMPAAFVGAMLAAVFASTMSTVDSQIISCTAAVSQSILPYKKKSQYFFNKAITVAILSATVFIAFVAGANVFVLVIFAWATLGVTMGTAIFIKLFMPYIKESVCLAIVLLGGSVTVLWVSFKFTEFLPEAFVGITTVACALFVCWLNSRRRTQNELAVQQSI